MSKKVIYIGATIGGAVGSLLGSLLDNGNFLGLWGIILGGVGGLVGIWAAYKLQA